MSAWAVTMGAGVTMGSCMSYLPFHAGGGRGPKSITWTPAMAKHNSRVMATEELTMRYPAGLERAVHLTKAEMEQHLRLMAALKMFELGKLSSGKAAELAGMSRAEFLRPAADIV